MSSTPAGVTTAHVVGHDWGGLQAWALGAWHGDRVAGLTVLSTPHPAAVRDVLLRSTQGPRLAYMAFAQLPMLPELALSRTLRSLLLAGGLPAAYAHRYADRLAEPDALSGALGWYRGIASSGRPGLVATPTTYVWGRHDPVLTRAAAEATEQHVTGFYRFVDLDAGHWLPETRPKDVAAAVVAAVTSD